MYRPCQALSEVTKNNPKGGGKNRQTLGAGGKKALPSSPKPLGSGLQSQAPDPTLRSAAVDTDFRERATDIAT